MAYTTIDNPTIYFNTVLYTGNATDDRSITGVGFQPDFVWLKRRDTTGSHRLIDSIRGATKTLISNGNNAEGTEADVIQAFESDGIQIGADSASNANSGTFVLWNWKAGGSASSNSNGSITSSVSASTDAGFSIVSYTGNNTAGATVGHGLSTAPSMVIVRNRNRTDNRDWVIYHTGLTGINYYIYLNTNAAQAGTYSNFWNDTVPSSSVITLGSGDTGTNGSSDTYIAYCFANVKGYSKFGSYTGNANADGPMIYTGFRPAWFLVKNTAASEHWRIYDNKRDTFNHMYHVLFPNENSAESTVNNASEEIDFLSNGVKIRSSAAQLNGSGNTLIYMAFAESPFVNSNGIPNNAR